MKNKKKIKKNITVASFLKDYLGNMLLATSALIAIALYLWIRFSVQIEVSQATILDRYFALLTVTFLYVFVIATPVTELFVDLPFKKLLLCLKPSLLQITLLFLILHGLFAFFGELDGFEGLGFLDNKYILAISLSASAFLLLLFSFFASFKTLREKLPLLRFKYLHQLFYFIVVLILIHALILGSDFSTLSGVIPVIFFIALVILLGIEAIRVDRFFKKRLPTLPSFGASFSILLIIGTLAGAFLYLPSSSNTASPFNVHAVHIQLAKQAQQGQINTQNFNPAAISNNPGLIGDRTRRFTVSFYHPDQVLPNQDTTLDFQVYDASNGNQIELYQFVYSKLLHLVIVDNELNFFNHIHPTQQGSHFLITTQFPHPGRYHLYLDFQPLGAIEQQFGFTLDVGDVTTPVKATQTPDKNLTKTFGDYSVTLKSSVNPLRANELSIGNETMTFHIADAKTQKPITTLKPYLAAFGHLVLINEATYDYIHVHPTNLFPPLPDANGGPDVEFLPLGLYGPIKPGTYRVFAQFNPDNNLFTSNFTIKVQ